MAICWYHLPVALNIKDPEVDRLAAELADRLHTSKTAAIRHALSAQLAFLESRAGDREAQLLDILRTEIWPLLADRSPSPSSSANKSSATTPQPESEHRNDRGHKRRGGPGSRRAAARHPGRGRLAGAHSPSCLHPPSPNA